MRLRRRLVLVLLSVTASATASSFVLAEPPAAATTSAPAPASAPATSAPSAATSAPSAATSAPSTATSAPASSKSAARGAIVIAITDDAIPAAKALAREVYGEEGLRPSIDDATARVLAGEAAPANGGAKLTEISDVRKAAQGANNDAVTRRLLASLGADLGAAIVIPVAMRDGKPTARVLSVAKGAFEPVELSATIEAQADGSSRVKWAGVAPILSAIAPKGSPTPASSTSAPKPSTSGGGDAAVGPIAPKKEEAPRSFWSSPWTWAGIGVVVTAGVVVFAVSQSQGDSAGLRLQGRVSP